MAALSAGAAAIHFAVTFEHLSEDSLYGVFFLVLAWAQLVWPVALIALPFLTWVPARARPARFPARWSRTGLTPLAARRVAVWLWLGIVGNSGVLVIYFSSRSIGLPIGPDTKMVEAWGGLDLVCAIEEILLVVIAATTAVMTPAWAGSEGPAGMASDSSTSMASSSDSLQGGMGDMGSINGLPVMQMYGNTNAPTAAQVAAAANLIEETDASLARFENVNNALAAGYTYRLATNGEEHLLYDGGNPAYQGLNPQDPSSLVHALNVKGHAPILLGAMYLMPRDEAGPQIGGGLTRWHSPWRSARAARSSSPDSTSRCAVTATRPPGRTSTPRRCCTSGWSPTPAASSPTT